MWSIKGRLRDFKRDALLTWDNGTLTGDSTAIRALQLEADLTEYVGPVGGPFIAADLSNGQAAAMLAHQIFEPGYLLAGSVGESREPIDAGAVG